MIIITSNVKVIFKVLPIHSPHTHSTSHKNTIPSHWFSKISLILNLPNSSKTTYYSPVYPHSSSIHTVHLHFSPMNATFSPYAFQYTFLLKLNYCLKSHLTFTWNHLYHFIILQLTIIILTSYSAHPHTSPVLLNKTSFPYI